MICAKVNDQNSACSASAKPERMKNVTISGKVFSWYFRIAGYKGEKTEQLRTV